MSVKSKNRISLCFYLFLYSFSFGKELFITRDGNIDFFSSTPIEDIKAINSQVSCVLNKTTGEFAFQVPIKGFVFKNALMQEHFNENYLESDTYPNASFTGSIEGWKDITLSEKLQPVSIKGTMNIHGISKDISESGNILMKGNRIIGSATFKIIVADYNIEIPKILRDNIAKVVDVTVDISLKKK